MDYIEREYFQVCVLEYMHLTCLCIMCVDRIDECIYVSVGIYIHIACMLGKCILGYEYFIYSKTCFLTFPYEVYASNTLNAYSLHVHVYDRCGVCVCSIDVVVSWGKHTLVEHWHARTRPDVHAKALWWQKALRWRKSVSLTVSYLLPTGSLYFAATNWPRCRPQSSPDWAPWRK